MIFPPISLVTPRPVPLPHFLMDNLLPSVDDTDLKTLTDGLMTREALEFIAQAFHIDAGLSTNFGAISCTVLPNLLPSMFDEIGGKVIFVAGLPDAATVSCRVEIGTNKNEGTRTALALIPNRAVIIDCRNHADAFVNVVFDILGSEVRDDYRVAFALSYTPSDTQPVVAGPAAFPASLDDLPEVDSVQGMPGVGEVEATTTPLLTKAEFLEHGQGKPFGSSLVMYLLQRKHLTDASAIKRTKQFLDLAAHWKEEKHTFVLVVQADPSTALPFTVPAKVYVTWIDAPDGMADFTIFAEACRAEFGAYVTSVCITSDAKGPYLPGYLMRDVGVWVDLFVSSLSSTVRQVGPDLLGTPAAPYIAPHAFAIWTSDFDIIQAHCGNNPTPAAVSAAVLASSPSTSLHCFAPAFNGADYRNEADMATRFSAHTSTLKPDVVDIMFRRA